MVDKAKLGTLAATITRIIPGIDTYQDKERLRESDKQVRNQLADMLAREGGRIETIKMQYARKGHLEPLEELDRLTRTMQKLTDTIRHAACAWSPVFDQACVDLQRLDQISSFDRSLEDAVTAVHAAVDTLPADTAGDLDTAMRQVESSLSSLEHMMEERERLIRAR